MSCDNNSFDKTAITDTRIKNHLSQVNNLNLNNHYMNTRQYNNTLFPLFFRDLS